jgi:menaquinol-cytochrome c reductase iron-sulfur subunit
MNESNLEARESGIGASLPEVSRRQFLERLSIALGGATAILLAVPVVGFVLTPLFRKPPGAWRSVGKVEQFAIGETVAVTFVDASPLPWAGVTANNAAWLRRNTAEDFIAFAINCTHLGCPVRWLKAANLFMCPCHGGVYYQDGTVAAGPPPKPLTRYTVRVRNGEVELRAGPIPLPRKPNHV